jgi:transcriptional regulator with XRE-family HTH domain
VQADLEAAGLTLRDVSARCGIDQPALSRLENGHTPNPTLDTLWRYAAAHDKRLVLTAEVVPDIRGRAANGGRGAAKKMAGRKKRTA